MPDQKDQRSLVYLLDPWAKLIILGCMVVIIFAFPSPGILWPMVIIVLVLVKMAKIPIWYMIFRLRFWLWFLMIGNLFYFFFTPGRVLYHLPGVDLYLTYEGVKKGVTLILQVWLIATASFWLVQTTSIVKLIKCFQVFFYPLFLLKIPVPDLTLMMVISLQFIPFLLTEGKRMAQVHRMLGGYTEEKGLVGYIKALSSLAGPVFFMMARKAHHLALAIELRGYTGEVARHHFYLPEFHSRDWLAFILAGLWFGGLIAFR